MKKRVVWSGGGLLILVLGLGVLNIFFFDGTPFQQYPKENPAADAIRPILEKKCLSCHSPAGRAPYYAIVPPAKQLIARDMKTGTLLFNLEKFMNPPAGEPFHEAELAHLEQSVEDGSMPPPQFLALHWDCRLSAQDKDALRRFIKESRKAFVTRKGADVYTWGALQPLPEQPGAHLARAVLGNKLFHDKRLSGDNTISCATCHDLAKGGTDQKQFSTGVRDQRGPINSPTVFNARYNFVQFWDGRAKDLKEQAAGPVTNPIEMDAKWPKVLAKLRQDPELTKAFDASYPDGITQDNVQDAIAEFEKTLVTPHSRFDRYLRGDQAALSKEEAMGLQVFLQKGCQTCHVGKILGGQSFEKMGLVRDYFADRGGLTEADNGRFNVTKKEEDRHYFKVPTLRNIELTFPYFHDGSRTDLKQAVKVMGKYQIEKSLSDAEAEKITAFLKTLTDETLR